METVARTDTLRKVELPEGVEIHVRVAGLAARSLARLIDLAIYICAWIAISIVVGIATAPFSEGVSEGIMLILLFVLAWFYDFVFEVFLGGATLGKRALGLRVVRPTGAPITWSQSMIRNILRVADALPVGYLFGTVACLVSRNFQRIGDLAAGTVVVYAVDNYFRTSPLPASIKRVPPPADLDREEQRAIVALSDRAGLWSELRLLEMSDHLRELTGATGREGYARLLGMAAWLRDTK